MIPRKASWYHILVISLILAPALLFQSVVPVIGHKSWEAASESLYPYSQILSEMESQTHSPLYVIKVGRESLEAFGWPVPRDVWVRLLGELNQNGSPLVLSFLRFQELASQKTGQGSDASQASRLDQAWIEALRDYRSVIGSGVDYHKDAEPTDFQEEQLIPRMIMAKPGRLEESLPFLPLSFSEFDRYSEVQSSFGLGPRFGTESVVHCSQLYLGGWGQRGISIPTSLLWAIAHFSGRPLELENGAVWPQRDQAEDTKALAISYEQCMSLPHVTTSEWFAARKIEEIELADALAGDLPDLAGRLVVLASEDTRRFRGPGLVTINQDPISLEYQLAVRLVDDVLAGSSIGRSPLYRQPVLDWMPLALAAAFLLSAIFLSARRLALLSGLATFILVMVSLWMTNSQGQWFMPVQTYASGLTTSILLLGLHLGLKMHGARRVLHLGEDLRSSLGGCNHIGDLEQEMVRVCASHFAGFEGRFGQYNKALHRASESMDDAVVYVRDHPKEFERDPDAQRRLSTNSSLRRRTTAKAAQGPNRGLRIWHANLEIRDDQEVIGTIDFAIYHHAYERDFLMAMVGVLRGTLSLHWNRIHVLAHEQIKNYEIFAQRSRSRIISRFLPGSLVQRFHDAQTMEQNLKAVLEPRSANVSVLQADIRGFSNLTAQGGGLHMVTMLQDYYRDVVDMAQMVAQVKLIGDCIFLFVEEPEESVGAMGSADVALFLAGQLADRTVLENANRPDRPPLVFGIAIHFGEAVIGNLSSENCIDYTVMGDNVNMVARIEETTKYEAVADLVGPNGVLLSDEAMASLRYYANIDVGSVNLKGLGVEVRSFSHIRSLRYLRAEQLRKLKDDVSLEEVLAFNKAA